MVPWWPDTEPDRSRLEDIGNLDSESDFDAAADHYPQFNVDIFRLSEPCIPPSNQVDIHFEEDRFPGLLRGVPAGVLLSHKGELLDKYLKVGCFTDGVNAARERAAAAAAYSLSLPATKLDTFVSHSWSDSGVGKWLALAVFFRSRTSIRRFFILAVLSCIAQLLGWEPPGMLGPRFVMSYTHVTVRMASVSFWKAALPSYLVH
mmetsp:Transcript_2995/g.6317  ORF Transcript_2995/g.6317 Transcript_2995/m.6317 type:complete len:204 (-) Transcript_2995:173-784(-)